MADEPKFRQHTEGAENTERDNIDKVGVVWRILGVPIILLGLAIIAFSIFLIETRDTGRGVFALIAIGILCVIAGIYWLFGKKAFGEKKSQSVDLMFAGVTTFDNWSPKAQQIANALRSLLLRHSVIYILESNYKNSRVFVGWYRRIGFADMAILLVPERTDRVRIFIRVGPDSSLQSESGPLEPAENLSGFPAEEFASIDLYSEELPEELPQWLDVAARFTRKRYNLK